MSFISDTHNGFYDDIIHTAIAEDLAYGDVTTDNLDLAEKIVKAELIAKDSGVLAGFPLFQRVFMLIDENIDFENFSSDVKEGARFKSGDIITRIEMSASTLLKGERTALNILTHLCGIASYTDRLVMLCGENAPAISETRKTLPGLRALQKYAVRIGGGLNHRMSLSHSVLIKNNHIDLSGGIVESVSQIRANIGHTLKLEVETRNLDEVKAALEQKADIIMLDIFNPDDAREASKLINKRAIIELSGGITESNISEYLDVGADVISIGALTHSVKTTDLALHIYQ